MYLTTNFQSEILFHDDKREEASPDTAIVPKLSIAALHRPAFGNGAPCRPELTDTQRWRPPVAGRCDTHAFAPVCTSDGARGVLCCPAAQCAVRMRTSETVERLIGGSLPGTNQSDRNALPRGTILRKAYVAQT